MNEEQNLQTAKRFYQAVNERDLPAILKLLTDDIDWKDAVAGKWPGSAWCHGLQEFERYGGKFFELLDIQKFEPDEFISGRDNLVVEGSARYVIRATGRLVIRPSGTEPVIRVMAEADDRQLVESLVDDVCDAVASAAAA